MNGCMFNNPSAFSEPHPRPELHKPPSTVSSVVTSAPVRLTTAANTKDDLPYLLPSGLLDSISEGISGILIGNIVGSPEDADWGSGLIVEFEGGGGIIYNPERL